MMGIHERYAQSGMKDAAQPMKPKKDRTEERNGRSPRKEGERGGRRNHARRSKSCATTSTGRWPPCFDALEREKTPLPCSYARLRKLPLR